MSTLVCLPLPHINSTALWASCLHKHTLATGTLWPQARWPQGFLHLTVCAGQEKPTSDFLAWNWCVLGGSVSLGECVQERERVWDHEWCWGGDPLLVMCLLSKSLPTAPLIPRDGHAPLCHCLYPFSSLLVSPGFPRHSVRGALGLCMWWVCSPLCSSVEGLICALPLCAAT